MRISREWQINEHTKRLRTAIGRDDARYHKALENLRHLQIDQMRRMQRLPRGKDKALDAAGRRCLEQDFKNRRSVDDDQRLFLSARTAAAGDGRGRTG